MHSNRNTIIEFSANIPQPVLDDLQLRIKNTRWPTATNNTDWNYGSNLLYMKELAAYWTNHFDWRKTEQEINAYPNFLATIDGYTIHFLHIKGKGRKTIPLIITHGWPGSFIEMMKLIPLLTNDEAFSFDLVIPSVIGFGFSGNVTTPGCDSSVIAALWNKLMQDLGYSRYGAQGGDIGAGISTWLSLKYPDTIIGLHLNYIPGSYKPWINEGEKLTDEVIAYQQAAAGWLAKEGAYALLHSTRPLTLAYGLQDSPVGLCGWIIEKFNSWSDNGGHIENTFTKDELLANITLYWITQTIYSSARLYYENSQRPVHFGKTDFIQLPVAFARFPKELPTPPLSYIKKGFNIQHWTEMPAGGHFAAMEQPVLLANNIKKFFSGIT